MLDFTHELTIPAGTTKLDPTTAEVNLTEGLLERVIITWQPGPRYLVYTSLWYGGHQFAPAEEGQGYHYDDFDLTIYPKFDLTGKEHVITVKAWSPDTNFPHTLFYTFSIDKPANLAILQALQSVFG